MSEVKKFSAKYFHKIDIKNSTLLDVREPSETIVRPVNGAIQIPFFELSKKIDSIPKEKPVYVFCTTGDRSEQVAEILADREFEVYNIEGSECRSPFRRGRLLQSAAAGRSYLRSVSR